MGMEQGLHDSGGNGNDEEIDNSQDPASEDLELVDVGSSDSDDSFDSDASDSDSDSDAVAEPSFADGGNELQEDLDLDEEDPVVKAIVKAKEKKASNRPPDLKLNQCPTAICFHQSEDLLAVGNYNSEVFLYSYSNEKNEVRAHQSHVEDSTCREIIFSHDGEKLMTAFSDQTIKFYDIHNEMKLERTIKNATTGPVSSLYVINENMFATGDDDGYVQIWDKRTQKATTSLRLGNDAITSMVSNEERKLLVCTSEEGAIYAVKIGAGKVQVESEVYDYEFNCACVFKQESKLAVGDGKGDVYIFNWDEFGKHSDIYTGIGKNQTGINAMIPITERIIISGADDGFIRAYHYFPRKYLGVVGRLPFPVEKMDVCNDGHLVATIGSDETVKFWNVSYFENMSIPTGSGSKPTKDKDGKDKGGKGSGGGQQDMKKHNLPSSSHQNASDFFQGLA